MMVWYGRQSGVKLRTDNSFSLTRRVTRVGLSTIYTLYCTSEPSNVYRNDKIFFRNSLVKCIYFTFLVFVVW